MSNKDYYKMWLKVKQEFQQALHDDQRIQEFAVSYTGIKPQSAAVDMVARVYGKYCGLYNKLCECYDQMEQVQRRTYIKTIIDAITCRIVELKNTLEAVEVLEFTYTDNACQQMLIKPDDIDVVCPFFYPFEIRQAEMQHIIDEIFSGNRIGDPKPTPSQLELLEIKKQVEQERLIAEREDEIRKRQDLGLPLVDETSIELSPAELDERRLRLEYEGHVFNIQRMERGRITIKEISIKKLKDENLYLELAGLKKPPARKDIRQKAALMIHIFLRKFMKLKRDHLRENKLKEKLDMIISHFKQPSAKLQLDKVKEIRRNFRRMYFKKWLEKNMTENARVLKVKEGDIMEDISDEIRQWFQEWFRKVHVFDEFPYPEEGGSILVVKGETLSIEEYIEWKEAEEKRLKAQGSTSKSKEQIKAEKLFEREERKRIALEAKDAEAKRLLDYKKSRLNPESDPGVNFTIGKNLQNLQLSWENYQNQWKQIDEPDAALNAVKGHIEQLIIENAYKDVQLKLRPIVDEVMRLELDILKNAMKSDYNSFGATVPPIPKRKKPKKIKEPKPEKIPPTVMFQVLADAGVVRKYPRVTLDDFWGDRNYSVAESRAMLWTPTFPPPSIGDVKEQVRIRCLLTLGASCDDIGRTQLFVGPKGCGKKTLVYAVATECNALLIDLSPYFIYDKFPGTKNTKMMWTYINKISRIMQPTIIFVEHADKLFYKKVPKEDKMFDPTRLSKDFFKEIVKPLKGQDKILVLGTCCEPWLSAKPKMIKVFPNIIMVPRTDYGSISFILKKMLMEYQGVDREFNVHSIAQILKGYDIGTIKRIVEKVVSGKRQTELSYKPLHPLEIVQEVLAAEDAVYVDPLDEEMFRTWYLSYSSWGSKFMDYMYMLETQYKYKLKAEEKK